MQFFLFSFPPHVEINGENGRRGEGRRLRRGKIEDESVVVHFLAFPYPPPVKCVLRIFLLILLLYDVLCAKFLCLPFLRGGGRKKLFYSRLNLLPNPLPLSFLFFAVWLLPTRLLSERQGGAKKKHTVHTCITRSLANSF